MIRDRIAAVLRREFRIKQGIPDGEYFPSEVFEHVAEVLVRELKLRRIENGRAVLNEHPPRVGRGIAYMTAWEPAE